MNTEGLADDPAQEFLLAHVILEGFAAIDENNGYFVVELAAEFRVSVDIDFVPDEAPAARELVKALLYDFAEVTAFAGVDDDPARFGHANRILAR